MQNLRFVGTAVKRCAYRTEVLPSATTEDPRYAIRTANVGTWHPSSGLNDQHQAVVVR